MVFTSASKYLTVRAKAYCPYQSVMSLQYMQTIPGAGIPQANCLIVTTTGKHSATWMKGNRAHTTCMPKQNFQAFAGCYCPEPNGQIFARAGNQMTIGTESHSANPV